MKQIVRIMIGKLHPIQETDTVVVKHFCNTCVLILADSCTGFERSLVTIL